MTRVPESQFAHLSSKTVQPAQTRRVVKISCVTKAQSKCSIARTQALLSNMNIAR